MSWGTVVVPLDGSDFAERAVPVAKALAEAAGAGMLLVSSRVRGPDDPSGYLERVATQQLGDGAVETAVVWDRPAPETIELMTREDEDRVVCMTTHGRGRLRWAMLGSVAESVVAATSRPLVLVGPHCSEDWSPHGPVLVGLDGTEGSEGVVPAAAAWARTLGSELHGAIVIHPLDVPYAEHPETLLDPIARRLADHGISGQLEVLRASFVAGALVDHANDINAAMLAMTAHARGEFRRLALGSVSMGVVGLARCPVIVSHQEQGGQNS